MSAIIFKTVGKLNFQKKLLQSLINVCNVNALLVHMRVNIDIFKRAMENAEFFITLQMSELE